MIDKHPEMIEAVTRYELAAMVRASFGKNARVVHCEMNKGGLFNASYRIKLKSPDTETILRVAPTAVDRMLRYERTMMLAEPRIYDLMRSAGVPVPRVLFVDGSRSIVLRDYIFLSYVDGVGLDDSSVSDQTRTRLLCTLGKFLAKMHGVTGDKYGWPTPDGGIRGSESWTEVFGSMLEEVAGRCSDAGVIGSGEATSISRRFARNSSLFDACKTPSLTHNDIWDPNVIVRNRNGWRIAAIIDADRAMFADREFETALWGIKDPEFTKGYGKPLDSSDEAALRRRFYELYANLWQAFAFNVQIWRPDSCDRYRRAALSLLPKLNP